jgi:hypothetical protein
MPESVLLRTPYAIAPRTMIESMIEIGYLQRSRRMDAKAVESALDALVDRINERIADPE